MHTVLATSQKPFFQLASHLIIFTNTLYVICSCSAWCGIFAKIMGSLLPQFIDAMASFSNREATGDVHWNLCSVLSCFGDAAGPQLSLDHSFVPLLVR